VVFVDCCAVVVGVRCNYVGEWGNVWFSEPFVNALELFVVFGCLFVECLSFFVVVVCVVLESGEVVLCMSFE
jgi:hypothetical protein